MLAGKFKAKGSTVPNDFMWSEQQENLTQEILNRVTLQLYSRIHALVLELWLSEQIGKFNS